MRFLGMAAAAAAMSACATVDNVPDKRPMTAAAIEKIGETPVVIVENLNGIEKSWFFTSSQGAAASYGLIGAFTALAIDAVANAKPSHRAAKIADKVAEVVPADGLSDALASAFARQKPDDIRALADVGAMSPPDAAVSGAGAAPETAASPVPKLTLASVARSLRLDAKEKPADGTVDIVTQYLLSEDAAALRVTATATYASAQIPYVPPYVFEKSPPKSHRGGPVYKNVFIYESDAFPLPYLSEELKADLVAAIEEEYRDESGSLPLEGDAFEKMTSELEDARDNSLSKMEASIFLARNWISDDGGALRAEIDKAHAFIAKYVVIDLNDTAVPNVGGADRLVEELADGRTIRLVGAGPSAGSYVSAPGRAAQSLVTFGNTSKIADVNQKRESDFKKSLKPTAKNK